MPINLIRPELLSLKPYEIKRGSKEGLWLDANESPWEKKEAETGVILNRYPSQIPLELIEQLAKLYQISPDQLLLTRGSDEGIDILIRLFCRPYQDAIIISPPTFSMYSVSAKLQAVEVIEVPLVEKISFEINREALKKRVIEQDPNGVGLIPKIIFICSPNNPTGNIVPVSDILQLAKDLKDKAIIVVDEAYIEYANAQSVASLVSEMPNLIVLRTLSKAFGLAGLRCGVVIAHPTIISFLKGMMSPFPFSVLTLNALHKATKAKDQLFVKEQVEYLKSEREKMYHALKALPLVKNVWPSEGNFLLVQFHFVEKVLSHCHHHHVFLRDFQSDPLLQEKIRISIGLAEQNQYLLKILKEIS